MTTQKEDVFNWEDIAKMFGVRRNKALSIIASIKRYSDIASIKGKVLKKDIENWENRSFINGKR